MSSSPWQRIESNVAVVLVFEREGWRFLSDVQADFFGRGGFGGDRAQRHQQVASNQARGKSGQCHFGNF